MIRQPDSRVRLVVDLRLRNRLAAMAKGRALVLDYFASRRCGVTVGDLTARFRSTAPADYVELATIESVRLFVEPRLLDLLGEAGPSLHLAGLPFARHVGITLDHPERWMEFLDGPWILVQRAGVRRG